MLTAIIWLVWASLGWAFDSVAKDRGGSIGLLRAICIPVFWTAAAILATIVANR